MIPRGKKENGKKYSSKKSEGGGEKNENQNRKKNLLFPLDGQHRRHASVWRIFLQNFVIFSNLQF